MKTASDQFEKYTTLKTRQNQLSNQQQRLEEKKSNLEDEIRTLEDSAEQAKSKFAADEKRFVRDELNAKELAASKAERDNIVQKLTDKKRLWELTVDALMDISAESDSVNQQMSDTLKIYTTLVKNEIFTELGADQNVREKILEAYAARIVGAGDSWGLNWFGFAGSIFPEPSNDEIKKAVADFRANRKL